MSTWSVPLKTHKKEASHTFDEQLNPCVVHGTKPLIHRWVVGRRKDVMFTATCQHTDCNKLAYEEEAVVEAWNRFNPISPQSKSPHS